MAHSMQRHRRGDQQQAMQQSNNDRRNGSSSKNKSASGQRPVSNLFDFTVNESVEKNRLNANSKYPAPEFDVLINPAFLPSPTSPAIKPTIFLDNDDNSNNNDESGATQFDRGSIYDQIPVSLECRDAVVSDTIASSNKSIHDSEQSNGDTNSSSVSSSLPKHVRVSRAISANQRQFPSFQLTRNVARLLPHNSIEFTDDVNNSHYHPDNGQSSEVSTRSVNSLVPMNGPSLVGQQQPNPLTKQAPYDSGTSQQQFSSQTSPHPALSDVMSTTSSLAYVTSTPTPTSNGTGSDTNNNSNNNANKPNFNVSVDDQELPLPPPPSDIILTSQHHHHPHLHQQHSTTTSPAGSRTSCSSNDDSSADSARKSLHDDQSSLASTTTQSSIGSFQSPTGHPHHPHSNHHYSLRHYPASYQSSSTYSGSCSTLVPEEHDELNDEPRDCNRDSPESGIESPTNLPPPPPELLKALDTTDSSSGLSNAAPILPPVPVMIRTPITRPDTATLRRGAAAELQPMSHSNNGSVTTLDRRSSNGAGYAIPMQSFQTNSRTAKPMRQAPPPPPPRSGSPATSSSASGYGSSSGYATGLMLSAPPSEYSTPNMNNNSGAQTTFERPNSISLMPGAMFNNLNGNQSTNLPMSSIQQQPTNPALTVISTKSDYSTALSHAGSSPAHSVKLSPRNSATGINVDAASSNSGFDSRLPLTSLPVAGKDDLDFDQQQDTLSSPCDIVASAHHHKPSPPSMFGWVYEQKNRSQHHHNQNKSIGEGATPTSSNAQFNNDNYDPLQQQVNVFEDVRNISTNRGQSTFGGRASHIATHYHHQQPHQLKGTYSTGHYRALNCATTDHLFDQTIMAENNNGVTNPGFVCDNNNPATSLDGIETSSSTDDDGRIKAKLSEDDTALFMDDAPSTGTSGKKNKRRGCAACCCSIFSIIRWTVIGLAAIFFIVMLFIIGFTLKERSEGVSEQDALKKIFCAVGFTKQCHHEADALNGTSIVTLQPPSTTTPVPPTTIASSILPPTESQTEPDKNSEIPSTERPIQVTSSAASVPEIPPKNQLSNEPANSADSAKVQNPESITNSKVASAPVADQERGMQTESPIENREEENFDKSKSAVSTTKSEDVKNETNSTVSTTQAMSTNQTELSMNSEIENSDGNSLLTSSMNQNEAVNQTSDSSTVTDPSVASMSSSTTESTESPTSAQTSSTTTTTTTTTEQSIVMSDVDNNSTAPQTSTSEVTETVTTAPSMIVNNSSDPSNIETSSTTGAPINESMNAQETTTQKTSTTQRVVNRLRSLFRSDDTKPRPLSPTVAETRSDTDETMKPAESANTQTVVKSAANKWLGKITGLFKSKEVSENNANSTSDASLSHSESGQAEKIDSGLRKTTEEMKNETNSTVAAAARSDVEKSQETKLSETIAEIDQEPESREISNNGTSTVVEQAPPLSLTMTIKEEKKEQNNGSVAAESMAHSSSDTVLNQMMNGAVGVENQTASTNSRNSEASQETSTTNENNSQQTEFSSESATRTMKNGDTDEMIATSNSSMEQMSQSPSSNGNVSGENSTASSNNRLQVLSDVSRDSNEMSTHQSSSSTTLNSAQTQETIVKQIADDLATNKNNKNNKNLNVNLNSEELSLTFSAMNDAVTQSNNQNSLEAVKERAESRSTQESSTVIITEKSDAMNQVSPANASDKQESDSNDSSGILLLENNNGNSDNREGEEEEKRMKNANNTSIAITETITRSNDSERTDSMLSFAIPADNSVNKSSTTAPSSWSTLLNSKKISASNNTDNAAVQHIENFKTQNSSTISTSTSAEVNSNSNNNSSSRKSRGPSVFVFDIATPQNSQNVMENNSGEVGEKFHHLTEKIVKLTEGHSIRPESRSGSVTSEQQQDKMSEQLDSTVAKQNRELATKYQSREFEVVVTGAIRSQSNDTNDAEMGAIRTMESKSVQSTNASVHRPLASSSTNSSESIKLSDKETTELSSVDADEIGSDNDMRANAGKMSKNGKFTSTHSIMSSESADNNTQKNHEVQNHESVNQESSSSSSSSSSTTLITKTVSSKSVELSTQNSLSSSETKVNQQNQELKTPMGREALESQINRITNNTITIDDNNSEVKLENSRLLTELATSALSRDEKSSVISLRSKSLVESNANNDASAATTTEMSMTFETTTMRPEDDEMDAKTTTTTTMSTIDSVTPEVVTDAMMSTFVLSEMEIDSSSASFSSPDLVMMTTTETSPLLAATTTLTPEVTTSVPTTITLDSSETTTSLPSDTPRRRTSLYSLLDS